MRDSIVVGLGNVTKNNDQEDWCWWGRVGSLSSLQAGGDQGSGAAAPTWSCRHHLPVL